jgi:hypothetical protein
MMISPAYEPFKVKSAGEIRLCENLDMVHFSWLVGVEVEFGQERAARAREVRGDFIRKGF